MGHRMSNKSDKFSSPEDEQDDDTFADMTPEQYKKLMEDIENFNTSFLSHLAGTSNYELVPTENEFGEYLEDGHYKLIKKECAKTGAKILYTYSISPNISIVIEPKSLKSIILQEGELH
jgi:hypothetical protein